MASDSDSGTRVEENGGVEVQTASRKNEGVKHMKRSKSSSNKRRREEKEKGKGKVEKEKGKEKVKKVKEKKEKIEKEKDKGENEEEKAEEEKAKEDEEANGKGEEKGKAPQSHQDEPKEKKGKAKEGKKEFIGVYKLGKLIGEGTGGKVYVATHEASLQRVAIKTIDLAGLSEEDLANVKSEIALLKMVQYPHIVKLLDVVRDIEGKKVHLVFEYLGGGSLQQWAENGKEVPLSLARILFRQMLYAIVYLHHISVCHRDIKLENFLLRGSDQVKLSDFGYGRIVKPGEGFTDRVGSPHYAAPEVLSGKTYDGKKADIWSAGVCLYALCTQRFPFSSDDPQELSDLVCKGEFVIPDTLPEGLQELLRGMLSTSPSDRPTAAEVLSSPWMKEECKRHAPHVPQLDTSVVYKDSQIDLNLVETLRDLRWTKEDIIEAMKEEGRNVVKACYSLMLYRRDEVKAERNMKSPRSLPRSNTSVSEAKRGGSGTENEPKSFAKLHAVDAGVKYASTTNMLSRDIVHSQLDKSAGSSSSFANGKNGRRRRRVVSVYMHERQCVSLPLAQTKSTGAMEEATIADSNGSSHLVSSSSARQRPVSLRERNTEIRELLKRKQEGLDKSPISLSDDEGNVIAVESDGGNGSKHSRHTIMSSVSFAGHPLSLRERSPAATPRASETLFERAVEKDYLADEAAACVFEMDVQPDIIVSDGDEHFVLDPTARSSPLALDVHEEMGTSSPGPADATSSPSQEPISPSTKSKGKGSRFMKKKKKGSRTL